MSRSSTTKVAYAGHKERWSFEKKLLNAVWKEHRKVQIGLKNANAQEHLANF